MRYISFFDCVIVHNLFFFFPQTLQAASSFLLTSALLLPSFSCTDAWARDAAGDWSGRRPAATELPFAFEGNPWVCIFFSWAARWTMNSAPHVSLLSSLYSAMFRAENEQLQANPTFFCSYLCVSWWYFACSLFNHLDFCFCCGSPDWSILLEVALKAEDAGCLPAGPSPPQPPRHQISQFIIFFPLVTEAAHSIFLYTHLYSFIYTHLFSGIFLSPKQLV